MSPHVLVTGGAGYIGSHVVRKLLESNFPVVVVDNLYSGNRWAVPDHVPFVEGNAGDSALTADVIRRFHVTAALHFAGHIIVPESVSDPLKYYGNNTCVSRNLIETCVGAGVDKFIFSSSAAVYGEPKTVPVSESAPVAPINPYGTSKLLTEWMLRDVAASDKIPGGFANKHAPGFRYAALRYFNVAGASDDGLLGQATPQATHLIKIACEVVCGVRPEISIFGTDYGTRDGTCIRDYIHVDDLADAHIAVLRHLMSGGKSAVFNCGYGRGFTVREIMNAMRDVSGVRINIKEGPRRQGDPESLIADATAIQREVGFHPTRDDIHLICESALKFERKLLTKQTN